MKPENRIATLLLSVVAAAALSTSALAQVSVRIMLAPPAPVYEAQPVIAPGYVWAPGYWALNGDRHVWMHGRSMLQRDGYRWEADRWDQRGDAYVRQVGHWERDPGYQAVKPHKEKKSKHNDNGNRKGGKDND